MLIKSINDEINRCCIKLDTDMFLSQEERKKLRDKVDELVVKREKITGAYKREEDDPDNPARANP